jgi:hypothetical protein
MEELSAAVQRLSWEPSNGKEGKPMKTSLRGPHVLSFDILERVLPKSRTGIFALGFEDREGRFRVQSVGRDDYDLRARLCELIGSSAMFKFATHPTARQAFDHECELFHALRPPSYFIHPGRPAGTDWQCAHCLQFH